MVSLKMKLSYLGCVNFHTKIMPRISYRTVTISRRSFVWHPRYESLHWSSANSCKMDVFLGFNSDWYHASLASTKAEDWNRSFTSTRWFTGFQTGHPARLVVLPSSATIPCSFEWTELSATLGHHGHCLGRSRRYWHQSSRWEKRPSMLKTSRLTYWMLLSFVRPSKTIHAGC